MYDRIPGIPRQFPSEVWAHTYTSAGSVNTTCMRYGVTRKNIGSDILYIDDTGRGAIVKFMTPGIYAVSTWYYTVDTSSPGGTAILLNPTGTVTGLLGNSPGNEVIAVSAPYTSTGGNDSYANAAVTKHFYAGDFVQFTRSSGPSTASGRCGFIVTKVA